MNSLMRLRRAIITAGSIITPTIHFANTFFIIPSFADRLFFVYHGWWREEVTVPAIHLTLLVGLCSVYSKEELMRFSVFSVTDHHPELPRTIRQFYAELLDEIVVAEQLGFSAFFLAEHHFHEYGIVPAPPILLAAAGQQTTRIGLGVAVSVFPFHPP